MMQALLGNKVRLRYGEKLTIYNEMMGGFTM
jgi:hypothetical protein